jgi:hypothetical protein
MVTVHDAAAAAAVDDDEDTCMFYVQSTHVTNQRTV